MQTETGIAEEVKADWIVAATNMSAQLTVTLIDFLSSKRYTIQIRQIQGQKLTIENKIFYVLPYSFSFPYENTKPDKTTIESTKSQAAVVGSLASLGTGSSPATNQVFLATLSMDPTGLTTKASQ